MTIAFVNVGTVGSGAASVAPGIPASVVAGDLLILFVQTSDEAPSVGGTWPPVGWTEFRTSYGPGLTNIDNGIAPGGAGAANLWPAYKIATGSDVAPTVPDSGDHQFAQIIAYTGVDSDFPFEQYLQVIVAGGASQAMVTMSTNVAGGNVASTALSWPTRDVQGANRMVLLIAALGLDSASSTTSSGYANANLSAITERIDQTVSTGTGGGLVVVEGTANAGTIAATTGTVTSCTKVHGLLVLRPAATPTLSSPGATSITTTTATPQVTLAY